MKSLLTALILFSFAGCSYKSVVPPPIATLDKVEHASIDVSKGCICGEDVQKVYDINQELRKHEDYYFEQVSKYNKEFAGE